MLKSPKREIFEQSMKLGFKGSNNEAKYETLINWLKKAKSIGIFRIKISIDSQLVVQ